MWSEIQMEKYLKDNLREARFKHSLGVRDTAEKLALIYGADVKKARLAGLIHDAAKEMKKEQLLDALNKEHIAVDNIGKNSPSILHGPVGAIIAKKIMGVEDEDVLNAIHYHTTGRENMSLLEKIIYLADYIEPGRNFSGVEVLREAAYKDLKEALIMSFDNTIKLVISRGELLHINTIEARNYIICEGR